MKKYLVVFLLLHIVIKQNLFAQVQVLGNAGQRPWVADTPFVNQKIMQNWDINGNSGTTTSNFIGNKDSVALIFRTNNLERARITASGGNLLLGTTTNAGYKLDIVGEMRASLNATINGYLIGRANGTANMIFGNFALTNVTTGTRNIAIGANATRYNKTGSENIAIGNEAMNHVNDTAMTGGTAVGNSTRVTGHYGSSFGYAAVSAVFSTSIGNGALATGQSTVALGRLSEASQTGTIALGAQAKVSHGGGIVIGHGLQTTAPYQLLIGNTLVGAGTRDVYIGGGITQQLASTYAPLTIQPTGQSGTDQTGQTIRIATGKGTGNGVPGDIHLMTSVPRSSGDTLQNLTTSVIVKGATGNVGIGTTTPAAQLHTTGSIRFAGLASDPSLERILVSDANGNIAYRTVASLGGLIDAANSLPKYAATRIKVNAGEWPDYVFDRKYKLQSLAELETYIQKHKHLPEVPSAKEAEKEGVNPGENQALLLKKIEELTLHLIEMDKRVKQLETDNKLLMEKAERK